MAAPSEPFKRTYTLGVRQQQSEDKRSAVLAAARKRLEEMGPVEFTLEKISQDVGITRQTVHNLFGGRAALLEALFDQMAFAGGMHHMRDVMTEPDPHRAIEKLIQVFCEFWQQDRKLLRRIHGMAATDAEIDAIVAARNERRAGIATRLLERLGGRQRALRASRLAGITSFEVYDALAETLPQAEVVRIITGLAQQLLAEA